MDRAVQLDFLFSSSDTSPTDTYTLSLHDALPISLTAEGKKRLGEIAARGKKFGEFDHPEMRPLQDRCLLSFGSNAGPPIDRKSTRLNSSHGYISYAVFCLKKKITTALRNRLTGGD